MNFLGISSIIPSDNVMFAHKIHELENQVLCPFLKRLDEIEQRVQASEVEVKNIQDRRIAVLGPSLFIGGIIQTLGTLTSIFLRILSGVSLINSLGLSFAITTLISTTVSLILNKQLSAEECGRQMDQIRMQRLKDKVECIKAQLHLIEKNSMKDSIIKQLKIAKSRFQETLNYYTKLKSYTSNQVLMEIPTKMPGTVNRIKTVYNKDGSITTSDTHQITTISSSPSKEILSIKKAYQESFNPY